MSSCTRHGWFLLQYDTLCVYPQGNLTRKIPHTFKKKTTYLPFIQDSNWTMNSRGKLNNFKDKCWSKRTKMLTKTISTLRCHLLYIIQCRSWSISLQCLLRSKLASYSCTKIKFRSGSNIYSIEWVGVAGGHTVLVLTANLLRLLFFSQRHKQCN